MRRKILPLLLLLSGPIGVGIVAALVSIGGPIAVRAAGNHNIPVGPGFTDVSPHQLVRTSGNVLYTVVPTCDSYPNCPSNTLRVYRANQAGTPTGFTEQDSAHRPSGIGSSAIAIDGADTLHVLWNDRAGTVNYRTFSAAANTWSATTVVASSNWTDFGQGDEGVALAVDSSGMPHAVWSGKGSDGILHVFYGNRGGSWSAQQVDDLALTGNRRTLHPTIAFAPDNSLVVAWLEGTFNYAPDGIIRVRTRDVNGAWATTQTINDPDGAMTTIDNGPSLLITADGTIHLTFLAASPADQIRYWYNSGAGWQGDRQPPTQITHDPSLGPDGNGGVYIYGHGTPTPVDGHGDNLYTFHKAAGATVWEPWTQYVTGSYDSSVTTRWAQFFQSFPQTLDIAYWADAYPNSLFVGTDVLAGGTATPTATVTVTPTVTPLPTATAASTSTPTPMSTSTPTPAPGGTVLIGVTTLGNELDYNQPGSANAFQYTAAASGTVTSLAVYLDASSTAGTVGIGLYSDGGGQPGTLLTQGTLTAPRNGAWNSVSVAAAAVTAGRTYWLAVLGPVGGGTMRYWQVANGGPAIVSAQTSLTSLPTTWQSGQRYGASPLSAYAATSGGTPTSTPTLAPATATPTPTATIAPTPTATATATATPVPATATATIVPTPTKTPTASPTTPPTATKHHHG